MTVRERHTNILRRFLRSADGGILVLWIMSLVAVLAFVALVFDIGRVQVTHGELQSFADSVALAAAGELDGRSNAITRATNAAALVSDTNVYGGDGVLSGSADYTLTFLTGLPADDTADPSSFSTTSSADAVLARVQVTPVGFGLSFFAATRALLSTSGSNTASVGAEAIAGFTMEACDIAPLMFCAPHGWSAGSNIGQGILLRSGGQGTSWGPGDFGFLDVANDNVGPTCAGLTGAKQIGCLIGAERGVTRCYSQRGVSTEPGQRVGLNAAAFNTRFDRFEGIMKQKKNDSDYTVAPNIVSGLVPKGACKWNNPSPSTNSIGLPHDTCFDTVGCSPYSRFGDGVWDYDTYVDTNHGNGDGVLGLGEDSHLTPHIPTKYAGTRYGVYVAEIAAANGGDILVNRDETGVAQCSNNVSTDPRRRVVYAAAIDCTENPISGRATNVPVQEFVEIFMTEPVGPGTGSPKKFEIWGEVIGTAGLSGYGSAGSGGVFRDVVQLYR
jgi:hypothetical protein